MLLYIASVFVPVRILYPIVHIYSSTCVSSVQNLGKFVGKCGEWLVEDVRKMWRRFGERGGESCRKVFEERLAIVRY